ncbi:hypothetical protein T11_560 [Trichinella zimbabwensis]|uniref:Uncharacterized protein n=1 Tax=Trichinella zimbabwensis TaxID=268475 RepID=A0A0V1HXP2_9BILA|nr:hypothetical protein T11_560 [Trichinella zimbabwensis]
MQTLKMLVIYKERLNQLLEELHQLCTGPAEVELKLGLEEEERKMAGDDWSKYHMGFRGRKARALALMRLNGTDRPGRLEDQGNAASRSGPEMVTAVTSVHKLSAQLPRCDLPKFDGDITKFRVFWDEFGYRVHQRQDLPNAAKLAYLRDCSTEKASEVISSLSNSNADYVVALNRLHEECDGLTEMIRHQIMKIVQAPPKDVGLHAHYDCSDDMRRCQDHAGVPRDAFITGKVAEIAGDWSRCPDHRFNVPRSLTGNCSVPSMM